jgi:hypothetical protein
MGGALLDTRRSFDQIRGRWAQRNQQARDLTATLDDDDGVTRRRFGRWEAEPNRQIDDRQDDAAEIDDAEHELADSSPRPH